MKHDIFSYEKWRKKLNILIGIFSLTAFIIEVIFFFLYYLVDVSLVHNLSQNLYILYFLVGPSVLYIIIVLVCFLTDRSKKYSENYKNYASILCLTFLCGTVMTVHYVFPPLICICVFPMILSTIFGKPKMTCIIYGLSIIFFVFSILQAYDCFIFPGMGGYFKDDSNLLYNYLIGFCINAFGFVLSLVLMSFHQEKQKVVVEGHNRQLQLMEQLKLDPLTNLFNHSAIQDMIYQQVTAFNNESDLVLAILDIDDFKKFNDVYGHIVGDQVIVALADCIISNSSPNMYCSRYGGEEYAILFVGYSINQAQTIIEKIAKQLYHFDLGLSVDIKITFSCGIASYEGPTQSELEFFKNADDAMYQAKNRGKNCIVIHSSKRKNFKN